MFKMNPRQAVPWIKAGRQKPWTRLHSDPRLLFATSELVQLQSEHLPASLNTERQLETRSEAEERNSRRFRCRC